MSFYIFCNIDELENKSTGRKNFLFGKEKSD